MSADKTDRPAAETAAVLPTVREILRFDDVARALPEVLSGEEALDRPVRWVHVSETADVARLVQGGELLLSTGAGWPTGEGALRALGAQLAAADVAGLILELGPRTPEAPPPLVEAFRRTGLPFVVLHREARFIAITEAVHSRIIADQMGALRARDEIHALFTELSLRGSPADFIVSQAGRVLGSPVVLEDLTHQVLAAETLGAGDDVLRDWEHRSRDAHRGRHRDDDGDWSIRPVEARGMRWGSLIALPGEPHPAGRSNVLEQAAVALALSRLADRDADEWTRQSHDRLLGALLGRRFASESGLVARFEAAGFGVADRVLTGVAVSVSSRQDVGRLAATALAVTRELGVDALAAPHPSRPEHPLVLAVSARAGRSLSDAGLQSVARAVAVEARLGEGAVTVAVGSEAPGIPALLASIDEAVELLARAGGQRSRGATVQRVERRPLLRLVTALGSDPRMQEHSELMLRPLIEYDLASEGDLLDVLRAYVSHPGNRTRAATASHLSRSVFYQRIALIEQLLGVDLDDGETLSALHTALLARRLTS
ncbi:PucR family transcriptional regulator [Leifsonia poae]|uniref:PucR family transcriptional regulator n=1 Tax=Leifsonia poae TaxID=110933 RepID=UPI001CBA6F5E|nr:PucR family transcriptional regulator [Leifsonia poae]